MLYGMGVPTRESAERSGVSVRVNPGAKAEIGSLPLERLLTSAVDLLKTRQISDESMQLVLLTTNWRVRL